MSYCRLPIDFMIPCKICEYYESCKSYCKWELDEPDSWRQELMKDFKEYVGLGRTPVDMCDKCSRAEDCTARNNNC